MILEIEKMVSVIISLYNIEKVKKLERTLKEKEGNMELARKDIKMTQELAILTMVSLHLFCRLGDRCVWNPIALAEFHNARSVHIGLVVRNLYSALFYL